MVSLCKLIGSLLQMVQKVLHSFIHFYEIEFKESVQQNVKGIESCLKRYVLII
jgi:hypothetical protein